MGSLVPGWDGAGGVPPRELQEFDEVEQAQGGYFARLEQSKSLKRTSLDPNAAMPLQPIPSLQRASSLQPSGPQRMHPLSSSLGTASMLNRHHPTGSPTAPHPASAGVSHSAHPVGSPQKYQLTDWEAEFKSLSRKRGALGHTLARTSADHPGTIAADSGRSSAEHHGYGHMHTHGSPHSGAGARGSGGGSGHGAGAHAHSHPNQGVPHWWAHLDSGALNRSAAAEAEAAAVAATSAKDLRGSFKLDVPTGINLH